jgi:exopolysaccharide biosynthesis polyprenyl glycosylphosphotransferase
MLDGSSVTRRHLMTLRLLLVLVDGTTAAIVFLLVSAVRFEADPTAIWSVGVDVVPAAVLFGASWVSVFWVLGLYRLRARWGWLAEARDIVRGTVVVLAFTLSLLFLLHQDDVSRLFLALLFVVQPAVMLAGRAVLRRWFESQRLRGQDTNYMLIVGTGPLAQAFADRIESHAALGIKVLGHLRVGPGPSAVSRPTLGSVDEINAVFRAHVVDEVGICLGDGEAHYLEPVVTIAADEGKTVRVPRDADEGVLAGAIREEFDGFLIQSVVHDGQRDLERAIKRVIDVLGAAVALVVLSPLILILALAVWLRDGTPILFRQARVGRHGRPFTILKFRTMSVDAEARLPELAELNEVEGAAFKISEDPRVTRFGRFLRRTSLDELPQLLNVLAGDMSLVGPRPALPNEVAVYDIWHRRRLSVRPGMTGLWQIEARTNRHFDERAELDLRYIDQWSLWMDLGILLRTLPAVVGTRGR